MWRQYPRIFFELKAAWACQVIIEGLVDCVPDFDTTKLVLELLIAWVHVIVAALDLRCDGCDGEAATKGPLDCVALWFWKLKIFFTGLGKTNLTRNRLHYLLVLESLCSFLVKIWYWVCLHTSIFLIYSDIKAAFVAHAEGFESLLLGCFALWNLKSPYFNETIGRTSHK